MNPRMPLAAAALIATAIGCGGSDDSSSGSTSMAGLLERIPLTALDDPDGGYFEWAQISMGDVLKASELAELPRPDIDDLDASTVWYVDLARGVPVDSGGTGYTLFGPDFPQFKGAIGVIEEVEDEFGFSPFAIDSYISFSAPPTQMAVFAGELTLSDDLVDIGDGVVSAGEGEDFMVSPETRTAIRSLGRPYRLAESDGLVAVSLSTPLIEDWLSDGESLADDPDLGAAAEALDDGGSVAAVLLINDFDGVQLAEDIPVSPIEVPFSVIGIGTAEVEEAAGNVIVYVFADEDDAQSALPAIETGWTDGDLMTWRAPMADYFNVVSVEQNGRAVVVTATVTDIATTGMPFDLVVRGEPIFTHTS